MGFLSVFTRPLPPQFGGQSKPDFNFIPVDDAPDLSTIIVPSGWTLPVYGGAAAVNAPGGPGGAYVVPIAQNPPPYAPAGPDVNLPPFQFPWGIVALLAVGAVAYDQFLRR